MKDYTSTIKMAAFRIHIGKTYDTLAKLPDINVPTEVPSTSTEQPSIPTEATSTEEPSTSTEVPSTSTEEVPTINTS